MNPGCHPYDTALLIRLAAVATVVHLFEGAIPMPIPGLKIGLANVVILLVYALHGWRAAAGVALLRVAASSLLNGQFLAPGFYLSLAGTLGVLMVLFVLQRQRLLGPIGLAVLSSLAHISLQIMVVWLVFIPLPGLRYLVPVLVSGALVSGLLTGTLAAYLLPRMESHLIARIPATRKLPESSASSPTCYDRPV